MILVTVCSSIVDQLFSQYINIHTRSENRATTLSAIALLTKLPYVILAIALGVLAEKQMLAQFCVVAGSLSTVVWLIFCVKYFRIRQSEVKGE